MVSFVALSLLVAFMSPAVALIPAHAIVFRAGNNRLNCTPRDISEFNLAHMITNQPMINRIVAGETASV